MIRRVSAISLALLMMLGSPMTMPASAQPNRTNPLSIPVAGVVTGAVTGVFNGTATITRFASNGNQLVAVGTVTGTVTNAAGQIVQSLAANFTVPITTPLASCDILNLVLGPIHLDLLGLQIDLNQVVLNITAVPGAGNLLGNLLCAVAGLLDGGGTLRQVLNVLNDILAAL